MNKPLSEQTILVTGATDGIGKGTAQGSPAVEPVFCCTVVTPSVRQRRVTRSLLQPATTGWRYTSQISHRFATCIA
jgi:hypothetical protein